jgi:ABC-type transport system involved in multi-copper enzyme maturation permease subunit
MLFGPIFSIEMITSARRTRYLVARLAYVLILFLILLMGYSDFYWMQTDARAISRFVGEFFVVFSVLQLVVVVALTPAMVAGTISQEHERRTLDYLLTSQLTNSEIVLGKLAARLLHVGLVLIAGIPILFIVSLMGGIPPRQIVLAGAVTLLTLVTIGSLSMASSVWSRRTRDAVVKAYVLLLAVLIVPPIVWVTTLGSSHWALDGLNRIAGELTDLNPFTIVGKVGAAQAMGTQSTLTSVLGPVAVAYGGLSLVAIVVSVLSVRRVYLNAANRGSRRRRFRLRIWRPGLGRWPMIWKELFAEQAMMRLGWLASGAMFLIIAIILWWTIAYFVETAQSIARGPEFVLFAVGISDFLSSVGVLVCTARAATSVTSEKERDSWVTLLSTPLSASEILAAKLLGNLYAIRGLACVLAVVWGLAVVRAPSFIWVVPVLAGGLIITTTFGTCLGMLLSLASKTSLRSMAGAISILLIVSGGYLFCCMLPISFMGRSGGGEAVMLAFAPVIPFLLAIPGIVWGSLVAGDATRETGAMLLTFCLGMAGYLLAAGFLWTQGRDDFDRLNGRPKEER